ncbi:MAG TPA: TonB-dependent receptor [Acidobacteriota bacterium]|nr:TonB-dependent receptor [Acidobacteriota bacterium]
MMKRLLWRCWIGLLCCGLGLLAAAPNLLMAQATTGSITGTVTDSSGAVLPGVEITAINESTGNRRPAVSSDEGRYHVAALQPGVYTVVARLEGFQTTRVEGLIVQIDQVLRSDIEMPVGSISEEVSVVGNSVLVQSETAAVGQVFDTQRINDLPLNGRNFVQLATLSTGATPLSDSTVSFSMTNLFTGRSDQSANIAGGREGQNIFLIDGVPNNSAKWGGVGITPSVDAIQEFKVQHTFFGAEDGQGNSIVNIAIKSGGNDFHGTAYEFLRNNVLDARQWQDDTEDALPFKRNQFGFTLGGPIVPERTFFFVNYEGLRTRRENTLQATVPTPAMLSGDFSGLGPIYDPATTAPDPNAPLGLSRMQFPGNVIPPDRINPVAATLAQFFPAPNVPGVAPPGINLIVSPSARNDFDQFNLKIDHVFNQDSRIFGRYSLMDSEVTQPSIAPLFGNEFPLRGHNAVIQHTHTFSPSLLNEARVGFNRTRLNFSQEGAGEENFVNTLGWQTLNPAPPSFGLPSMLFLAGGLSGFGPTTSAPINSLNNTYQVADTVIWSKGDHNLKMGFEINHNQVQQVTDLSSRGLLAFNGFFSSRLLVGDGGNQIADLLLGFPIAVQGATGLAPAFFRSTYHNYFIQDDWDVSDNLTLNLGLRYEYNTPFSVDDAAFTFFDFQRGEIVVATEETNQISLPDRNNFAPRIGLAYRPFGNNKTAIRAGYGVYYTRIEVNELEHGRNAPPFNVLQTIFGGVVEPTLVLDQLFPPLEAAVPGFFTHSRFARRPYLHQFGLSIQHEVARNLLLDVSYAGTLGRKLNLRRDPNQAALPAGPEDQSSVQERRPFPNFGSALLATRDGTSSYHSGQFKLEKRFSGGLSFIAAYTVSKAIDMLSTVGGNNGQGIMTFRERPDLERGLAAFDTRNRFVFSYSYDLPFGQGRRFGSDMGRLADQLLGGWQINGIVSFTSGYPLTVLQAGDPSRTGLLGNSRPDRLADGNLPSDQRTPERWFDTAAFGPQPDAMLGDAGRGIITGPGTQNVDFSLFKQIFISEDVDLQFRAEFFNLLNRPNFNLPDPVLQNATFGEVLSAGSAREIQFGLKLIF